ncbi:MAG: hypothetical protein CMC28_04795 [Flavobacteriaceae bacterium]|nr:hypothetical protein [Flavobacteriaceae bacterium]|tara:strand:- start:4712 stop:5221 length:510 start_codon:yes stop_codon:yes gene_type:complete
MSHEIKNRVAESSLVTIDFDEFINQKKIIVFDLKMWLKDELILIEKDFRDKVNNHNWNDYNDHLVLIKCSNNAIIPHWAYLLISSKLKANGINNFIGSEEDYNNYSIINSIQNIDLSEFKEKSVIVKGCSNYANKNYYYSLIVNKIQNEVKSLMFGEACSSVPIFKRKK